MGSLMNAYRIAVFFAPPIDHPLWLAGSRWLGRDASLVRAQSAVSGTAGAQLDETWLQAPRRYGFHATLKPPFQLAPGFDAQRIYEVTAALARRIAPFTMPALSVQSLDDFLALRPADPGDERLAPLTALAAQMVRGLDACRLPAMAEQLAARRRPDMSAVQLAMLDEFGYPYVLDAWRFHMTLTGRLRRELSSRANLLAAATEHFAQALSEPLVCRDVCLFVEPAPGEPFQLWRRVPLLG